MAIGQQVNIPVLIIFVKSSNSFRISRMAKVITNNIQMDCNEEKFVKVCVSADSRSQ